MFKKEQEEALASLIKSTRPKTKKIIPNWISSQISKLQAERPTPELKNLCKNGTPEKVEEDRD